MDYVGSQRSGKIAHEGYPSRLIGDIAGLADSALTTYRPDVVLLHIGTNDMSNNVDPSGAPARLGSLIGQILRHDSNVTLLVSTIVPSAFPETAARIATYNAAIPGVVEARRAAGKRVQLVDMHAVSTANLADGLHPNDRGYDKMGGAFYDGFVRVAQAGWIGAPDGGDAPVGAPVKGWLPQDTVASGTFSGGAGAAVYADLNGDGRADYLSVKDDGAVQAWFNGGPNPKDGSTGGFGSADLNNDGRDDYLDVDPQNGATRAWINYS